MSGTERDLTPPAPLGLGRLRAGPVRTQRPVYVDLLPPCNAGCPAGENIQAWLALVKAGRAEEAWRQLTDDNPFPAIHGRVCYHPCEIVCNRAELDESVSIHGVERHLGDLAIEHGWSFLPPRPPAASGCWSSVPARAACPPPTTSLASAMTSPSVTAASCPAA